jgi:hypothetical protein
LRRSARGGTIRGVSRPPALPGQQFCETLFPFCATLRVELRGNSPSIPVAEQRLKRENERGRMGAKSGERRSQRGNAGGRDRP